MLKKCVFSLFAIGLLALVASQFLGLWPAHYLRWVHFATVTYIIFALVIAWSFYDASNGPERNEDCYPPGDIRSDGNQPD